jgi:hypothetical protein
MKKDLTILEENITKTIADAFPYSPNEVEMVYEKCKSFDKTIEILEVSNFHGISPKALHKVAGVDIMKKYIKR